MIKHHREMEKFVFKGYEIFLHGSRSKLEIVPEGTDWDYAVDYLYLDQVQNAISLG